MKPSLKTGNFSEINLPPWALSETNYSNEYNESLSETNFLYKFFITIEELRKQSELFSHIVEC